jgi:group I intron endonuclease
MEIYKITNKINGKFYIGKTIYDANSRLRKHRNTANSGSHYWLHNAMRKYGYENFIVETIEKVDDPDMLNEREIFWIEKLNPEYNNHKGGTGGSKEGRPDITGQARENWQKGFDRKGKEPWNKGKTGLGGYKWSKPMSDERKKEISEVMKNKKIKCIHCGLESNPGNIGRYHNNKCKKFLANTENSP